MYYAVLNTNDGCLERFGRERYGDEGNGLFMLFKDKTQADAYICYHEDMCCWACVVEVPEDQALWAGAYSLDNHTDWYKLFTDWLAEPVSEVV